MITLQRNQPFVIQVSHDQIDTDSFQLLLNGQLVDTKPVDPAGVQFPFPQGIPELGDYTFVVVAVGPAGNTPSDSEGVTISPKAPSKPVLAIEVTVTAVVTV